VKKNSRRKGSKAEQFVLSLLGEAIPDISETVNSGASNGDADLGSRDWLIEVKSTSRSSYSVTNKLMKKISRAGWKFHKKPILVAVTDSDKLDPENAFVVMSLHQFVDMVSE
jgi:hypothetical protein